MNPTLCRFDLEHAVKSGQGLTADQASALWALVEEAEQEAEWARQEMGGVEMELEETKHELDEAERDLEQERATADSLQQSVEELEAQLHEWRTAEGRATP